MNLNLALYLINENLMLSLHSDIHTSETSYKFCNITKTESGQIYMNVVMVS